VVNEATPQEYVERMVEVFRLARELLADDGTLWLNLGDCYAGSGRGGSPTADSSTLQHAARRIRLARQEHAAKTAILCQSHVRNTGKEYQKASMIKRGSQLPAGLHENARKAGNIGRAWVPPPDGMKDKNLMMMPARVALALQYVVNPTVFDKPLQRLCLFLKVFESGGERAEEFSNLQFILRYYRG
jgi:hypothetical protein